MPLDFVDYIDILFDLVMLTSAYIIYRVAKKINYRLSAISDKATEVNKALMESVTLCDHETFNALNHNIELLELHISKVDKLVSDFLIKEDEVVRHREQVLEKQEAIMQRQIMVLEKQEAIREIVKVIKDEIVVSKDKKISLNKDENILDK
jgi:hypothetical protein